MKQKINKLNNNEREIKKYRSITINYPFFKKKKTNYSYHVGIRRQVFPYALYKLFQRTQENKLKTSYR